MKPEEQRIAIAEACPAHSGWYPFGCDMDNECYGDCCEAHAEMIKNIPDYLSDLNAMHEAEKVLTEQQQIDFAEILDRLTPGGVSVLYSEDEQWLGAFGIAHATAAQRAEAFLRTLNIWKP